MNLRSDLAPIVEWIKPNSRVLDLGCGEGMLLAHLSEQHSVRGYGMEYDPQNVANCIATGVIIIQVDIDAGLTDFETVTFDHVVVTQMLQALQPTDKAHTQILRVSLNAQRKITT